MFWLFRLVFLYPAIGLPIVGVIAGYVIYSAYRQRQTRDWDSGPPAALHEAIQLSDVRRLDPAFPQVVFEDFAFRLFSTAHRARHTAEELATVAPYVSGRSRPSPGPTCATGCWTSVFCRESTGGRCCVVCRPCCVAGERPPVWSATSRRPDSS